MTDRWSSRLGFVLASTSAAVGLGNIWRFSAVVGRNGGGAYLLPYLVAAFVFALPLLVLEFGVGRSFRADVVSAFRAVRPELGPVGWLVVGSVFAVLSYYLVLTGWVLAFLVDSATGTTASFERFTGSYRPLPYFAVATLAAGGVVSLGVREGIERMAKVVMPVVILVLLGLFAYATTLSGFDAGVAFLLAPDLSVLADPVLWSAAFGQVFFSLSVGQGIMLTYGSYLDEDVDLVRSALIITVADIGVALLAGLVIFPVVFTFDLEPTAGTELAFSTLPAAFAAMPGGRAVAVAFFGLLFFAALSSAVSLLEVCLAAAEGATGRSRRSLGALLTGVALVAGLPSALSYSAVGLDLFGVPVLDLLDESVGTLGLPVTALLTIAAFVWLRDADAVRTDIGVGWLYPLLRYLVPAVLAVTLALRALTGAGARVWPRAPGAPSLATPASVALTLAGLLGLLAVGWWLTRRVRGRPRRE